MVNNSCDEKRVSRSLTRRPQTDAIEPVATTPSTRTARSLQCNATACMHVDGMAWSATNARGRRSVWARAGGEPYYVQMALFFVSFPFP